MTFNKVKGARIILQLLAFANLNLMPQLIGKLRLKSCSFGFIMIQRPVFLDSVKANQHIRVKFHLHCNTTIPKPTISGCSLLNDSHQNMSAPKNANPCNKCLYAKIGLENKGVYYATLLVPKTILQSVLVLKRVYYSRLSTERERLHIWYEVVSIA